MRSRHLLPAVAGLTLALVLSLLATSGSGASDSADPAPVAGPAATGVVAAAAFDTPITVPLVDAIAEEAAQAAADAATTTTTAPPTTTTTAPPTTTPPPPPAPAAPAGSVEEIITRYFGGGAGKAIAVARCESGLNPGAMSPGGGNHGLFQINSVHRGTFEAVTGAPWSAVYDAELNTRFAKYLHDRSGWGPWACA